jgi:RecA-family ATPase
MNAAAQGIEEVFARRQRFWQHGYRPLAVWNPGERVNDKGEPLNSPGKQPRGRWREDASRDPPEAASVYPDPRALNTGLLCGDVVAFDVDVLDQGLADQIVGLIERQLGTSPLVRIGRAPKILLVYRPEQRFAKVQTPELFFGDGAKAKVELLADGQQFVADGVHPDTGESYAWTDGSPAEVPLAKLPVVIEQAARTIIAEAEQLLRAAGGREKEKPRTERRKPNGAPGGDFFAQVNRAALINVAAWVRALFPRARFEPGTGAWRISSKDLGRDLEEDISIHPGGIRDFGEEKPLSAIDLVMRHNRGTQTPLEAALWLCERLRIDPLSLGYVPKPKTAAAPEPLRVVRVFTLQGKPVPQRRWLVPDWIPWRRVTGLYGAGGEGKTLLAQMLMTACALGQPWIGLPVKKVKVLGIFCEDDEDELHERQDAINKFYGCEFSDLENMRWIARLGFDNIIMTFDNGRPVKTGVWQELFDEAKTFGAQLCLFDTVADFFAGNENDRSQVRQFGQVALGGFARELDAAALACAHPSRSGITSGSGESGSTQWDALFRSRLYLTRPKSEEGEEPDPFARILYRKKANWAQREDEIKLRWCDGVFNPPIASTGILGSIQRRKARRIFLDMLADSRPVSANNRAGNYAPKIFAKRPDREGYAVADFERAMEDLFASKEIELETYIGANRHPAERIALSKTGNWVAA